MKYIVIIYKVGWLCGRGSSVVMRTTVLSVASRARTRTTASVIVTVTSALGIAFKNVFFIKSTTSPLGGKIEPVKCVGRLLPKAHNVQSKDYEKIWKSIR